MDKDKFTPILFRTLANEGGVDLNSINGSGISNAGVTQRTYDSYAKQKKMPSKAVTELNSAEIRDFYYQDLYKRPKLDKLPDRLSGVVFDHAVQSGDSRAVQMLQEKVGTKPDGIIGKKTLGAIKKYIKANGEDALIKDMIDSREQFLMELTVQDPENHGGNVDGYLNRMNKVRAEYLVTE